MDGRKPDLLMVSDRPYGVDYDPASGGTRPARAGAS